MLEVEMKFPVPNADATRQKLRDLGFRQHATRQEVDRYFNAPDRDFGQTDEALRIRQINERCILTYKGPKRGQLGKVRKEIEVDLASGSARHMTDILEQLRYKPSIEVKKARTFFLHSAQKDVEVSWDEVEGLGTFVELELKVPEEDGPVALTCLQQLAQALGLEKEERRSYLELSLARQG
jgi:adenylate cyclase, class 2